MEHRGGNGVLGLMEHRARGALGLAIILGSGEHWGQQSIGGLEYGSVEHWGPVSTGVRGALLLGELWSMNQWCTEGQRNMGEHWSQWNIELVEHRGQWSYWGQGSIGVMDYGASGALGLMEHWGVWAGGALGPVCMLPYMSAYNPECWDGCSMATLSPLSPMALRSPEHC